MSEYLDKKLEERKSRIEALRRRRLGKDDLNSEDQSQLLSEPSRLEKETLQQYSNEQINNKQDIHQSINQDAIQDDSQDVKQDSKKSEDVSDPEVTKVNSTEPYANENEEESGTEDYDLGVSDVEEDEANVSKWRKISHNQDMKADIAVLTDRALFKTRQAISRIILNNYENMYEKM